MTNVEKEVIPGLTTADVKKIASQIYGKTDRNHPQMSKPENGFFNILQNGNSESGISKVFIRRINL